MSKQLINIHAMNLIMNKTKLGGISALLIAAIYLLGFIAFYFYLNPNSSADHSSQVMFISANKELLLWSILTLYIVSGLVLLVLVHVVHEHIRYTSRTYAQISYPIGLIWSAFLLAAGSIYLTGIEVVVDTSKTDPDQATIIVSVVNIIFEALGGGNEMLAGIWILLISWISGKSQKKLRAFSYFGQILGTIGVISILPTLSELTAIFGLGMIVWLSWLGIYLLTIDPIDELNSQIKINLPAKKNA